MISDIFIKFISLFFIYLIGELFSNYEIFKIIDLIGDLIFICLIIFIILIVFVIVKEKYKWREV